MDKNMGKRMSSELVIMNSHLKSLNDYMDNVDESLSDLGNTIIQHHKENITRADYNSTQLTKVYSGIGHTNALLSKLIPQANSDTETNYTNVLQSQLDNQNKLYTLLENQFEYEKTLNVNSDSTVNFSKGLDNLGGGLKSLGEGLWTLGINSFKTLPFIDYIDTTATKVQNSVGVYIDTFSDSNTDSFKIVSENIGILGNSIWEFTYNSFKSTPFLKYNDLTVTSLTNSFNRLNESIGEEEQQKILGIGDNLNTLSGGILAFGTSLALSTPLYLIGVPGLLLASGSIFTFMTALRLSRIDESENIGKNLLFLSGGVLAFGASLALLSAFEYDVSDLVIIGTSLLAFSGVMTLLDKYSNSIIKGSLVLGGVSLSLLAFSYSLTQSQKLFNGSWGEFINDIGMISAGIGSMALMFGLLSMSSTYLIPGMLTLGGMSLSIYLYSNTLKSAKDIWGDWNEFGNDIGMISASIATFTAIFTGLTIATPFILPGMIALGGMSASIYTFGLGLKQYSDIDLDPNIGIKIGDLLLGIKEGILQLSPMEMLKLTLMTAPLLSLSAGLKGLAIGVKSFNNINDGVDYSKISKDITILLDGIQGVFDKIGASANTGTSLMKLVTGGDFKESNFEQGVESVKNIGDTLQSLADGVVAWADLKNKYPNLDVNLISTNIKDILSITYKVFEEIGNTEDANTSFTKLLLGNDLGTTAVQRGIISVKQLGDVLETLANGVESWAKLEEKLPNFNAQSIATNIKTVLLTVNEVFAEIGNSEDGQSGSLLKRLTGADFGKTATERGILAIKDSGEILDTLATGIIKWNSLNNLKDDKGNPIPFNRDQIISNIKSVLTVLPQLFKEIGEETESGGWFKSIDSDITRGLKVTEKFGVALNAIQKPITNLNKLDSPKTQIDLLANGYERISLAIRKIPTIKLTQLSVLMDKHKDLLELEPTNDKTLESLVDSLNKLIENTKNNQQLNTQSNNNVVTKEVEVVKPQNNMVDNEEFYRLIKNIYILLNSGNLTVKNSGEY